MKQILPKDVDGHGSMTCRPKAYSEEMPRVDSFPTTFSVRLYTFGDFVPVMIEQRPVLVVMVDMLVLRSRVVCGAIGSRTIFRGCCFTASSKHLVHVNNRVSVAAAEGGS